MPFFTILMENVPVPVITDYSLTVLVSRKSVWDHCFSSPNSIMIFRFTRDSLSLSESAGSKEICLLSPIKPWIQWGLYCLMKILRWASSWQNILYRYLQSKKTEEVSETPWKWCPFTQTRIQTVKSQLYFLQRRRNQRKSWILVWKYWNSLLYYTRDKVFLVYFSMCMSFWGVSDFIFTK